MGTRILSEGAGIGLAVFFDSVTGTAFGPVMDDRMHAEAFMEWLGADPASLDAAEISGKWDEFASTHKACIGCGDVITSNPDQVCDECKEYSEASGRQAALGVGGIGRRLIASATEWTADRVREELPTVRVRIDRDVVDADVSGRKTPFAKLHFVLRGVPSSAEVAWGALARSLNSNIPIAV